MQIPYTVAHALSALVLGEVGTPAPADTHNAARFIRGTHTVMNPLFREAIFAIALYFHYVPLLRFGTTFGRLSQQAQKRLVERWENSCLSFKRDFVQFFRNLAIQAYFDSDAALRARAIDLNRYRELQRLYAVGASYD